MTYDELDKIRRRVPKYLITGLVAMTLGPILVTTDLDKALLKFVLSGALISLSWVYSKQFRNRMMKPLIWNTVDNNIKKRFIAEKLRPMTPAEKRKLKAGGSLMALFYHIIDNDNSLTIKSQRVYGNGAVLSSLFDTVFFGAIGVVIFTALYFTSLEPIYLYEIWLTTALCLICLPLIWITEKRHNDLSLEQLNIIFTLHRKDAENELKKILQ